MDIYDSIIIGGGPAGLSAAIYLARFNRSALILDSGHGRYSTHEINENYLGFPGGISAMELRQRGVEQAKSFGAEFVVDHVNSITKEEDGFTLVTDKGKYRSRTIILATGVKDILPEFEGIKDYFGNSLFWCITCDGYKVRGKKVAIVGHDDDAVCTAMQFLNFTDEIVFITNRSVGETHLVARSLDKMKLGNIHYVEGNILSVQGENGMMSSITLDTGEQIAADYMINQQGATPNVDLAKMLGVKCNEAGYIETDDEQQTNIPFVYAAGDVTRRFAHQIVTAAHEGSMAGQRVNYDLYRPEQKDEV